MKIETFFHKFDQLADAPNAVAKMRELVLRLAVQGKLVLQDPNDEPAEKLIERVASALPNKKSQNPFFKEIETSITDETEYALPPGWAWLPLGNVGMWATGCGFPIQYQGESDREFLFCKVSDMNLPGNEVEIHNTVHSIEPDVMKKIGARANPVGTVIFPKIGGAIATHKRRLVIKPTIIDNNCSGIQPIGLTNDRWLLLFMRNLDLTKYQSGTSVPAVSQGSLDPIRIGLPPLAEQHRIVAKVDELMALCDRLEAQLREREAKYTALSRASLSRFAEAPTPANLEFLFHKSYTITPADLRKTILTLAVQGKLVRQDPNDEPAANLISQIAEEKRQLVAARIIRENDEATPVSDDELPFDVPCGWEWVRLSSITRRIHYGYTASAKADLKEVRLLRITDIQNNFVDWPSVPGCEIAREDVAQYQLERSDILVARTGGTVGKTYLVQDVPVVAVFASYLIRIQGGSSLFDRYLKLFLESPTYWVQLEDGARGAAQPNVNGQTLGRMVVSVPPLAEQHRIVAKVDQLMALVAQLETQLTASRATAANLMDTVAAEITTPNIREFPPRGRKIDINSGDRMPVR